jgi:hypothetical protein
MWSHSLSNMYTVATGLYLLGLINFYWLEKAFDSHWGMFWVAHYTVISSVSYVKQICMVNVSAYMLPYIHICSILITANVHIPNTYLTWSRMNCLEDRAWCSEDPEWHIWMCASNSGILIHFISMSIYDKPYTSPTLQIGPNGLISTILSNRLKHSFHTTWKIICTLIYKPIEPPSTHVSWLFHAPQKHKVHPPTRGFGKKKTKNPQNVYFAIPWPILNWSMI